MKANALWLLKNGKKYRCFDGHWLKGTEIWISLLTSQRLRRRNYVDLQWHPSVCVQSSNIIEAATMRSFYFICVIAFMSLINLTTETSAQEISFWERFALAEDRSRPSKNWCPAAKIIIFSIVCMRKTNLSSMKSIRCSSDGSSNTVARSKFKSSKTGRRYSNTANRRRIRWTI